MLLAGPPAAAAADTTAAKPPASKRQPEPRRSAPAASSLGIAAETDADFPGLNGQASFYGQGFKGRRTASGERFDPRRFTAASNRFPLGTRLAVLRPDTGRCAVVRVNDRMHARHRRRIIDVSRAVAEHLQMLRAGVVLVRVVALADDASESGPAACRAAFAADGIEPDDGDPDGIDPDDEPPAERATPG